MDVSTIRRTLSIVASAALITALTVGSITAPVAAKPDEHKAAARAEAKAAREAAKQARAQARADAKAARDVEKRARAEARALAKAARKAAKQDRSEKMTVCHKPGTPAAGTLEISMAALQAHLNHGDVEGACDPTAPDTSAVCPEPGASDSETPPGTESDQVGVPCGDLQQDEEPPLVVSIDAPASIGSQDLLRLEGAVSGPEADELSYVWSSTCLTDEQLSDSAIVASEPGSAILVIRGGILPRAACDFTLTVTDEDTSAFGTATVTVEVSAVP